MGSATQVLLSVDAVGETTVDTSLFPHLISGKIVAHFPIDLDSDEGCRLIKRVPVNSVPLHEYVDVVFPHLSEVILSQYYVCVTLGFNNIFTGNLVNFFSVKHNIKGEDSPQSSSLHVN